jgi:hypothetical protein
MQAPCQCCLIQAFSSEKSTSIGFKSGKYDVISRKGSLVDSWDISTWPGRYVCTWDTGCVKYFFVMERPVTSPELDAVRGREKVNEPARAYAKDYGSVYCSSAVPQPLPLALLSTVHYHYASLVISQKLLWNKGNLGLGDDSET